MFLVQWKDTIKLVNACHETPFGSDTEGLTSYKTTSGSIRSDGMHLLVRSFKITLYKWNDNLCTIL